MEAPEQAHSPNSTLAICIGLFAGLVACGVALVMLRVYLWRRRLSTVTATATTAEDGEPSEANSSALIATTVSMLDSPRPQSTNLEHRRASKAKCSTFSTFHSHRMTPIWSFTARVCNRGLAVWSFIKQRFRRKRNGSNEATPRFSQTEVEVATPTNCRLGGPGTPEPSPCFVNQLSSKVQQLTLFRSPSSNIGMI